jgi:hydrogenase nickel incorporation protein HypB
MCHLDAVMCAQGLEALDQAATERGDARLDLAFLENVGNLVCPAEFDTGASANVMILSVPEGDDKPLKYPLMFQVCDVVLVSKVDVMPYFDFDLARLSDNVRTRNPHARVIPVCAKTGEGMDVWYDWLRDHVASWGRSA